MHLGFLASGPDIEVLFDLGGMDIMSDKNQFLYVKLNLKQTKWWKMMQGITFNFFQVHGTFESNPRGK